MMRNKIIALALTLIMLISVMPLSTFAASGVEVPAYFNELYPNVGAKTPIRPVHQYLYRQNPPVFLWTVIDGASSYDIRICTDEAMTEVVHEINGIKENYYHFKKPFETNKYYWWAYRFTKGSQKSDWCVARRFKVATDSKVFIVPTADEIIEKTGGKHPTMYLSSKTIPELKEKIATNSYVKKYFEEVVLPTVENSISKGVTSCPPTDVNSVPAADLQKLKQNVYNAYWGLFNSSRMASIAYHMTGESRYADYAVACLMEASTWDWKSDNSALAFHHYDTWYMESLIYYSLAYDWIRDYMTEAQRKRVSTDMFNKVMDEYDNVVGFIKTQPYESHQWSGMQGYGCMLMAILDDVPAAKPVFDDFVNTLMAVYMPLSIEDGGYGKGTNYWGSSFERDYSFMDGLTYAGTFDFYVHPFNQNHYLWPLYLFPTPGASFDSWGDGNDWDKNGEDFHNPLEWLIPGGQRFGMLADKPELLWWKNKFGSTWDNGGVDGLFFIETDLQGRAPVEYPRDWHFKDQGITTMHSDLIYEPRISASFRSGMYGAYNHQHADINSFKIESNARPLAWRNGYYGYYGSSHHLSFTRAAHAHNTITYDNGKGQPNDDLNAFDADGVTTMYLSNTDMSVAVGDGKEAYQGGLGKYDRTFIYMRPDSFIVIDNLAASDENIEKNGGSTFEWWINSVGTINAHDDNRGVLITYADEALDARVHYPKNVTPYYSNLFSNTDLQDILPHPNVTNWTYQGRMWFQTEKVPETKMVVTMDVHGKDKGAEVVKTKEFDNYMQIQFEDGAIAYISLATDESTMIDTGEFKFNGTAVVLNADHLMYIGGTELWIRGEKIIEADRPVAVTIGSDELGVSSGDDYNITIYPNDLYMPEVNSIRFRNDEEEVEMGMGIEAVVDETTGAVKVKADKGHYSLLINDKPLPGTKVEGSLNYIIEVDGVEELHTATDLYYDADYNTVGTVYPENTALKDGGEYYITAVSGDAVIGGEHIKENTSIIYDASKGIYLAEDNVKLQLKEIKTINMEVENTKDYDSLEKAAAVIVQMEDYTYSNGYVSVSDLAFPSLARLNDVNAKAGYEVTITEAGYYDLLFKYASGNNATRQRYFEYDGDKYYFNCALTGSYGANPEDYQVARAKSNLYFEPGTYTITFGSDGSGNLNIDWFGFIKN